MSTQTVDAWVPTNTFGTRLLLLRRELGLSVKDAAAATGTHYATWSTWENGRKPSDMASAVERIADEFGVDRNWLMWGMATPGTPEGAPLQPTGYKAAPAQGWVPELVAA